MILIHTNKIYGISFREVTQSDFPEWQRLRVQLYPEEKPEGLLAEIESIYFKRCVVGELDYAVWVAEASNGKLAGFIEVSLRPEALECKSKPVGYIESLGVDADWRRKGIARTLVDRGQDWVTQKDCREFYVDTGPTYVGAIAFYLQYGFEEIQRDQEEILYRMSIK